MRITLDGKLLNDYQVIDGQTGQIMGTYKTRKAATKRMDALDNAYGAYRYMVRAV